MKDTNKTLPVFVVDAAPTIKWPVIVRIPVDGGEFAPFQFTGEFKRMPEEDFDAILDAKKQDALPSGTDAVPGKTRHDVLRENAELFPQLMVGWDGVRTAAGEQVAFSATALKQQLLGANGTYLSMGLWVALSEIRSGSRLGN